MTGTNRLLVLGLGNSQCGDDGLGVVALALLAWRYRIPDGVEVIDGGCLENSLLPYFEAAKHVILIDAIRLNMEPGTFVRLEGDGVMRLLADRLAPHQVHLADSLVARWVPGRLILWGIVPETVEEGEGRSPAIAVRLPELVERVVDDARDMGCEFVRRTAHDTAAYDARCAVSLCRRPGYADIRGVR